MKRVFLSLAIVALASFAFSNPFVWPSAWTTTPLGEAEYGGTIASGTLSDPRTFQPVASSESPNETVEMIDYARLIIQGPESDDWIPYAAESFTISDDGTVFDLVLREGVLWSDGTPVTVEDYFTSYLMQTDPDAGSNKYDGWFVNDVQTILEITGERGLRFTFAEPNRNSFFTVATHFPVPERIFGEAYRTGGADAVNAIWGTETPVDQILFTGPFVLTSFQAGERLVFERNPYFGEWNVDEAGNPLPYLDGRIFRTADGDAQLNLFLAGELDLFAPRNLDDIGVINVAIQNQDIDAEVIEGYAGAGSSQFIVFNWNLASDPFLQNVFRNADFRRAMWHLVDRDTIIDLVYSGAAEPMHTGTYLPNEFWLDDSVTTYDYDPERASELLARAGFSRRGADGILVDAEGRRLSFSLSTNAGNIQREQITQIFADTAREVGVDVQTQALDFSLLVDQLLSSGDDRPFQAILIGLTGGNRVWPYAESVYGCTGFLHVYNTSGECLTAQETLIDQLIKQGIRTLDTDAAREIGVQIQELEAQQAGTLFTVSPLLHTAWTSRVGGEYPLEFMGAFTGTRDIPLTHIIR
jgi:peptide/nickel transport system substrate-binding protein